MKKSLSVAMVVAMVSSMFASLAFADEATTTAPLTAEQKYEALKKAGVLEGDENGASLDAHTNRAQIAKILAKAFNLTEDASAASGYSDITDPSVTWATGYIGAVTKAKLMEGPADGKFAPGSDVTMQELATVLVRAFDLDEKASTDVGSAKVDGWAQGYVAAALKAGLVSNKADFTAAALRSDLVYSTYVASQGKDVVALTADKWEVVDSKNVKVTFSDGVAQTFPLATALEAGKATTVTVVYKEKEFNGSVTLPVVTSQDISSAVALNSKVVEVKLGTAATTVDASNFTVKDSAGTAVAVASAQIAPYVTDGKTVLVTLGADTASGTLYTLTSGSKSVNFGGKSADTAKPKVSSVNSVDYNIIDVTFNETVDISGATITIAEKYGTQTALAVKATAYNGGTVVRLTTDDQKGATLYGLSISGVKDFAGNTMDADNGQTVVGTAKSTNKESVASAYAVDYKTVTVQFNENLDTTTLKPENFTVAEAYGSQTAVAVDSVRLATTSDLDMTLNATLGSSVVKKYAVITLKDGLKAGTLYKVTAANVGTLYGQVLDTSKNTANFSGVAAPTSLTITGVNAYSNTAIDVTFANKLDKASAETLANYAIAKTYGDKAALTIKSAALQSGNKTVRLTVDPMTTDLYTLTVTNVKDAYGNVQKTDSNANVINVAGKAVASKLSSVTAVLEADDQTLDLTFNGNVGATATDVAHYSIDGGIGYPAKVVSASGSVVKLSIPKTNSGQIYTVTVTGLENADNVAMDSAGIKTTFVGSGVTAANPALVAAIALDSQTVEVYFDQDVSGANIKGASKIWSGTTVNAGVLKVGALDLNTGVAYTDPANKNALIVRFAAAQFAPTSTVSTYTLDVFTGSTTLFASGKTSVPFAANGSAVSQPVVSGVTALNKSTLRVFFNQAVANVTGTVFTGFDTTTKTGTGTNVTLGTAVAADSSNTVYDIPVTSGGFDGQTTPYYFVLTAATDSSGQVQLKDENSGVGVKQYRQFAGSTAAVGSITSVPVSMTDARTLVVFYPEAMNAGLVKTAGSYSVTDGTTTTDLSQISKVDYDATTNKATITLSADLNTSPTGKYYLQIAPGTVSNAVGNKWVQSADTTPVAVKAQFATSTAAAAKVSVSSATYSSGQITINLSQGAMSASDLTVPANLAAAVKITLNSTNSTTSHVVAAADIQSVDVTTGPGPSTSGYGTKIIVTLKNTVSVDLNGVGKVELPTAAAFTGYNGMTVDTGVSKVFAQK